MIQKRIVELVNSTQGIKASFLCAQLSTEFLMMSNDEIRQALIETIRRENLVEVEYMIDYRNESFILPAKAMVVAWS